ncbi:MAG TPA: glycerol-3-phosphate acyltransferase [Candidatus Pacearchaeota archaeon]|nr:glycerol-3-phosphate acyltransferase [Candidatus Pacearchaeota archaeon]HPR79751.1 glycerol-3-phosphate acyltransferase [Candidatus Pacearchaeota archaeon]
MFKEIIILIVAYVLGSIPFGYLITKFTTKKNLLEIGWKKNSGSNVFKNVGLWQGIFTFVFDVLKGFLAVYLAQYFGLSLLFQVFCGVLAVIGHNWSCFLGFKGGRGLAALIGALFAISPLVLIIALIPCIIFTIIWTASVGTLLSFLTAIIFCVTFREYEMAGLLMFISLIPVLIKRLSPIKELQNNPNYKELLENRLIFDQDTVPPIRLKIKKKN